MILLLGGTSESREFAKLLEEKMIPYLLSAATVYGKELAYEVVSTSGDVLHGRLDKEAMKNVIIENKIELLVDLTHPFAEVVSSQAQEACEETKVTYLRFERKSMDIDEDLVYQARTLSKAWNWAASHQGKVFLTTGSKTLPQFLQWAKPDQLIVRVLPTSEVLSACEKLGLLAKQIIAMQGPFSYEMNKIQFKESGCRAIITKESGKVGGVDKKVQAALDLGLKVCVIKRPEISYGEKYSSLGSLFQRVVEFIS